MLSSGAYHLGLNVINLDAMLSSGAIMISSGTKCYHLELMISSVVKCYHLG
jgi:hypothetical protein